MLDFIARRLVAIIPVLAVVAIFVLLMLRLTPGDPAAVIAFEPQAFGTAANNGQMIAELSSKHRAAETFRELAQLLTGRAQNKTAGGGFLTPLLGKLLKRSK